MELVDIIISALKSGTSGKASDVAAEKFYNDLKSLIQQKFRDKQEVLVALGQYEKKPENPEIYHYRLDEFLISRLGLSVRFIGRLATVIALS